MNHRGTETLRKTSGDKSIGRLIDGLPIAIAQGSASCEVSGITEDSRTASPGCLFIGRTGAKTDGRAFAIAAVNAGAIAVLADSKIDLPSEATMLVSDDVAGASAVIAERFFGSPSGKLNLIGVTGTNGKTTTTYLIQQLLANASMRCGLIGTVVTDDGATREVSNLTTPPAIEISRWMNRMVANGCISCAMEASSHALHQKRTHGLNFRIGVFTNLTGDHLDYHKTMDEYLAAKAILFERLSGADEGGIAIVNSDDPASDEIIRRTKAKVMRCSEHDASAACFAKMHRQTLTHTQTTFRGPWGEFDVNLPLVGAHNVMNALQAMAAAHACGVNAAMLRTSIENCSAPPGRLEPVIAENLPFAVLVDYAHTDDALENVLRALRPVLPAQGKLRVVFGCGGDRDPTKRPRMARVACKFSDDVIITSDNPRTENPQAIVDHVRAGVPADRMSITTAIVDREQAIREAIKRGREGEIILIAGKGHEDYQIIGTTKRPFDDRLIAAAALRERFETAEAAGVSQ